MQKQNTNQVAAYYTRQARRYPRYLAGLLVSVPITVTINNYIPPLILAHVLNKLNQHHYTSGQLWQSFGNDLVLYAVVLISGILAWRLVDWFAWQLEMRTQQHMAEEVFDHMLDQSADFHANNFSGSLVSQANKLLGGYIRVADTTIFQVYPLLIGIVATSVILIGKAPLYVAGLLIFSATFIITSLLIARPVRIKSAAHSANESRQTGYLADAISNVMVIKSFARGKYEHDRFHDATITTRRSLAEFARVHRRQMNVLGILSRSISSLALFAAVVTIVFFNANIATVFLILSYTASIVDALFAFSNNALRNYNRAFGDAREMVNILGQKPEIQDPVKPEPVSIHRGAITFKDVTFSHKGSDDAIFEHLKLRIKPGEKVGLVGHSGSGKTTLTRILLRFSDVDSGQILIDNQNIASITQDDLHRHIAYVPQEPLLFHRTIAENIAYGRPEATKEEIAAIARDAHAAEFIDGLQDGYGTLVGERGVKLSGGQRQRIAIARAMLKNAPILVLDEATSALDSESEGLIQQALWKLMEGRTAIVIAHRLSTIQKMDRIIVLDDGKIVEEGSHKELIRAGGNYAKLWERQSGGFMED